MPKNTNINELSCLYGIKPLMKVIHGDSYVNKAELVKFTKDHTRQIDIVIHVYFEKNPLLLLNTPYSELNF